VGPFESGCGVFLSLLPAHREFVTQLRPKLPAAEQRVSGTLLFGQGAQGDGAALGGAAELKTYRKRAQQFCTKLIAIIGLGFGLAPPAPKEVGKLVDWLTRLCGGLGPATEQLVNRWAVTLFGFYRCHQRSC
jgi:hypothetical protein